MKRRINISTGVKRQEASQLFPSDIDSSILTSLENQAPTETRGWLLQDHWLQATSEEDDFFFLEGLQREKVEIVGKGVRDSLWSQGIQLEVGESLVETHSSVSRLVPSPFSPEEWSYQNLTGDVSSQFSIEGTTLYPNEKMENSIQKTENLVANKSETCTTSCSDGQVTPIPRQDVTSKSSLVWLTDPLDYSTVVSKSPSARTVQMIRRHSYRPRKSAFSSLSTSRRSIKPTSCHRSDLKTSRGIKALLSNNINNSIKINKNNNTNKNLTSNISFSYLASTTTSSTCNNVSKSVQRSFNLAKIVIYPKTKNSVFWVQEMNTRNNNNIIQPTRKINKPLLLSKPVSKSSNSLRKKCPNHNIKERARRSYIQSRFQELKGILGLKVTASKLNILNETVSQCLALQSLSQKLENNWNDLIEVRKSLACRLRKLKMSCIKY